MPSEMSTRCDSFSQVPSEQLIRRSSGHNDTCPPLNLEMMLSLEDKRKSMRRGSFLTTADVPRRSIIEHNKMIDYLRSQGFTLGLARTLIQNSDSFPVRIWLVNNSDTMNHADGHLVVQSKEPPFSIRNVDCTRWEEVISTLRWHAEFSARMEAPMAIRLLNDPLTVPQQLGVATSTQVVLEEEINRLSDLTKLRPGGQGTLTSHLREVVNAIKAVPRHMLDNRSIAVVFVTDSLPTSDNGKSGNQAVAEFLDILQGLEGWPVWFVIRLSTDEQAVVDFYGDLDNEMFNIEKSDITHTGLHLDVLDDFVSEAKEVAKHNPWLNYAYPLHLCRESAVNFPVFDALNDRPLMHDELAKFICLLFDRKTQAFMEQPLPNPKTEYKAFREEVQQLLQKNASLWNPIKKRIMPWIDVPVMDQIYSNGAASTCSCSLM